MSPVRIYRETTPRARRDPGPSDPKFEVLTALPHTPSQDFPGNFWINVAWVLAFFSGPLNWIVKKGRRKTVALESSTLERKVWNGQTASDPNSWSGGEELVGDGRLLTKMFQVLNRWLPVQGNLTQLISRKRHFWRVAILMKSRSLPPKTKRNIKMFSVRAVGVNSRLKGRDGKKKERERERKRGKKNEKPVIERLHPGFQKLWHYFIAVQFSLDLLSKESFRAPKKCQVKKLFWVWTKYWKSLTTGYWE